MAKRGKKYLEAAKQIDREAAYEPLQAIELVFPDPAECIAR